MVFTPKLNLCPGPFILILVGAFAFLRPEIVASQVSDDYEVIYEIDANSAIKNYAGKGGSLSSRFYVSSDGKFLILEYGYKPTVVSVFQIETFDHIVSKVVSPWVYDVSLDEDFIYTHGDDALRREVNYKISLLSGSKTRIQSVPQHAIKSTRCTGEATLQGGDLLLVRADSRTFRIYGRGEVKRLESDYEEEQTMGAESAPSVTTNDNIRIRMSDKDHSIQRVAVVGKEGELCNGTVDDGQGVSELVEGELLGVYEVVERKHLEEILQEQRLAMTGLVFEESDFARAGCLAGAQGTVIVSYACLQDKTKLQVKLVDCSTSDLFWSATGIDVTEFELLDALRRELSKR